MTGRISYISKRYSKVNNKNLQSSDTKKESTHIIYTYTDANNLKGYGMSKFLPRGKFK